MGARGPADADHPPPPADRGLAPTWGIPDAVGGFLAGLVGAGLTGSLWALVSGSSAFSLGTVIAGLVGLWVAYVGVCWWLARQKGSGSLVSDFGLRFEARDVGVGALWGLITSIVLVRIVYALLDALGVVSESSLERLSEPAERLRDVAVGWRFLVLSLFIGIGAPIVEELFFRGLLNRALIRRLGPWPGIVLGGLAFGLAHGQALQLPALAVFGVVLGWLAWRSGRLGPGIVAHMVFNGLTLVALAAGGGGGGG
jgi:uncharacterized protein